VPEAEFYEVDGIVSIDAHQLTDHTGWSHVTQYSSVSLISTPDSSGYVEPLSFPFYIQNTGVYSLWILGNREYSGSDVHSSFLSILDDKDSQLYQTILKNDSTEPLKWNHYNYEDQPISIQIDRPGHYRINISALGPDRFRIHKIHLTLDNENPPQGVGLPTTSDPGIDPVLQKREERMELMPSWIFGPVYGGYSNNTDRSESKEILERSGISRDEVRDWEQAPDYGQYGISDLKKNIEIMANPRFITYEIPYASYDVGGFDYKEQPPLNEELLIRWAQFSAFNSVMHLFSKEIYDLHSEMSLLSNESYAHINELVHLRNRLFPYIYSEFYLARGTGKKPIRGNHEFPTQYLFGDSFLVAPIVERMENERFVHLPSGLWYDYEDGSRYEGGQSWLVDAPLFKIPLFVKAGSIIPYQNELNTKVIAHHDSLLIEIYGGSVGTFRLYEDDGLSTRYKQGEFSTTAFRYFERDDYATFTIGRVSREFEGQSSEKMLKLVFKYIQKPKSVSANEVELSEGNEIREWYYDSEKEQMILNWVQSNDTKTDIELLF
tara:strand:+ start:32280 stop:33926 length:1647 start_codon:yes stop_codon:yes gene_type:complete